MKLSSLFKNKHKGFEEKLEENYRCYAKTRELNNTTMQAYQIYSKVLQWYNPKLKEKIDKELNKKWKYRS